MSDNNTAIVYDNNVAEIVADFAGGNSGTDISMMVGIGLDKDSPAVFFQYLGEEQPPMALVYNNGKPLTRMANVRLVGIDIAENVGSFNATKLNLIIESSSGRRMLLTSGLTTLWSQCVVTSLMDLEPVTQIFQLDSWKGTGAKAPCFAGIRANGRKVSSNLIFDQLKQARADRDDSRKEEIMRECINSLSAALGGPVEPVTVTTAPTEEKVDF